MAWRPRWLDGWRQRCPSATAAACAAGHVHSSPARGTHDAGGMVAGLVDAPACCHWNGIIPGMVKCEMRILTYC
eukprot:374035-Pelagomonas_calceolata.AAC.9